MKPFCVKIPHDDPDAMDQFQKAMDSLADDTNEYINEVAKELGVSFKCASDVWYLRGRSRHTPELELKLIELHKAGTPPNVMDWP